MAPDSRLWRHQLGEANTSSLLRIMLKTILPICLFLAYPTFPCEAKTEVEKSTSEELASYCVFEKPSQASSTILASLLPSTMNFNSSPVGRWSNRIQIPIPNEPVIQRHIRFYKEQGRTTIAEALERSKPYVPVMTEILESHGVPAEMLSVVIVESSFKQEAKCKGAGGYWQLLAATARTNGLRVDGKVDERRDPIKSTEAAAKYLRSFYDQFNSWTLALAAYNAGGVTVASAMKKHGTSDFWVLSRRGSLPRTTRAYVPKVLAAMQIIRDLKAEGFDHPQNTPAYDFQSIQIGSTQKFEEIARWTNVPVGQTQDLNPVISLGGLPVDSNSNQNLPPNFKNPFGLVLSENFGR